MSPHGDAGGRLVCLSSHLRIPNVLAIVWWNGGARRAEVVVAVVVVDGIRVVGIKWCGSLASFIAGYSCFHFVWVVVVLRGWCAGNLCLRSYQVWGQVLLCLCVWPGWVVC